ncbi:MAG TPA: hydroxymethylbilane synthase [Candidatus Paceibacterota bacterium]|jgi:hydroxymethylbilane synthase|nr:hydroxymethylbilane synthase [Candidatus Paceibacterota bacterium]
MRKIVLGTRGSKLGLIQTGLVGKVLKEKFPDIRVETKVITTKGDVNSSPIPLDTIGKAWFTDEIEQELMAKTIDIAVHSLKDVPTDIHEGSIVLPVLKRDDPRDVLVSKHGLTLEKLPQGAIVGTDSSRRKAQLLAKRPDLRVESIRGNVDTRLRKLREENYDAIVIAAAGLARLSLLDVVTEFFDIRTFVPAPGQATLAAQARTDDTEILSLLSALQNASTTMETEAERAFVERIGGGCKSPVGACARASGDLLEVFGMFADETGGKIRWDSDAGTASGAREIGQRLADRLLSSEA